MMNPAPELSTANASKLEYIVRKIDTMIELIVIILFY